MPLNKLQDQTKLQICLTCEGRWENPVLPKGKIWILHNYVEENICMEKWISLLKGKERRGCIQNKNL